MFNILARVAILNASNEVVALFPVQGRSLAPGETMQLVDVNTPLKRSDVWDGSKFVDNPKLAEIQLMEEKKKEFIASLQSVKTLDELKAAVTAAADDINKP